jgi:carbamoyltransferase
VAGPKREGDIADEPYIHYAASMQALFEKLALQMIDYYLGDTLKKPASWPSPAAAR